MNLQETTSKVKAMAEGKGGIGSSIKFATDEGPIYLTADGNVSNDNTDADCTVSVSLSDFNALMSGDLNPMTAFMFGKIKVSGDMGVAMKLQSLFG
ncbi:MAG: SCP2 sterol-binding domain-containing protein [Spirosomataceae bacterium]